MSSDLLNYWQGRSRHRIAVPLLPSQPKPITAALASPTTRGITAVLLVELLPALSLSLSIYLDVYIQVYVEVNSCVQTFIESNPKRFHV